MTADNKNVMAVGIFLCRPADKLCQLPGIGDGKIITGTECSVLCHDAVLSGISANTVVLVSFPFSGSFEQHCCRYIITGSIGCLTDTLGEECDYEIVRQIHENLTELAEEHKEDEIPLTLTKPEVKDLLEKSGVEPERLEHFDKVYEEAAGENTAILVPAITGTGKFAVKTPDVDIKVNPDRLDLVETKFIGGRRCLVIAVEDNVEVNGMPVKMWEEQKEVQ